jgi:hypothetical protein
MTPETKSDTIEIRVNGELFCEFIVDHMSIEVTRREVLLRGRCRDNYADKVMFSSEALDRLGYALDASDIPPVRRTWLRRWFGP